MPRVKVLTQKPTRTVGTTTLGITTTIAGTGVVVRVGCLVGAVAGCLVGVIVVVGASVGPAVG